MTDRAFNGRSPEGDCRLDRPRRAASGSLNRPFTQQKFAGGFGGGRPGLRTGKPERRRGFPIWSPFGERHHSKVDRDMVALEGRISTGTIQDVARVVGTRK